MSTFKIGAIADSFRKPPREGVQAAKDVGAEGIQIYAVVIGAIGESPAKRPGC